MELGIENLKYIVGGGLTGGGASSPSLPKKSEQQSIDTESLNSSLVIDPTAPLESPKP
ncbi:hypothetical protein [Pseudoalteromonas phenolica]|uniref:hypothetical protein n=1 Tax=Pseudoalteromonas phenolica TaxID=161398 RepID=UPI0014861ADD|nr:hypothetical protein [Pseudoalteromonas phenolica]